MRRASIFLSTIQVMVVASSSTASAQLRGLQGSTGFGLRKGHERITKRIGESHSGSASYGYGIEFQGSIPRDSKAKKQKVSITGRACSVVGFSRNLIGTFLCRSQRKVTKVPKL